MHLHSSSTRASLVGIATVCAAALTLAGCATYEPRPLDPASLAKSFEARRLDDPELASLIEATTGGSASRSWDLSTLTIAGICFNPRLEVARATWRVSRAAIVTAATRTNPSLDASAGRATNVPAGAPSGLADLRLGIPIETAGKREHRIEASERLSEAARLEIHTEAWKVRSAIRDALLDWSAAKARSEILAREADSQRSIVEMVERRVALGAASSTEAAAQRAALARVRLDRAASRTQAAQAKARLAAAIGIPGSALDRVAIVFPSARRIGKAELERSRHGALFHRADIRAALQRHAAAESTLQLEIAKQYPDVEIGPGYSYDAGTNKLSLGVIGLTLPLLDRNEGPIAEAKARRDQTAREFESLQDGVLGEVDGAVVNARDARRRVALANATVAAERARWQRIERRFETGEEDRLALATARTALFSAQRSYARSTFALEQAIARLEDAIQTPLFDTGLDAIDARIVEGARP